MSYPLTGDSNRRETRKVEPTALPFLRLENSEVGLLGDKDSWLNDAQKSGKRRGAMLVLQSAGFPPTICVAAGSNETDVWYNAFSGTVFTTPA